MASFYETVLDVLKTDKRFVAENGTFLRNAVYEAAMQMDKQLIRMLLENDETCKRFFVDVDGVKVFDKTAFAWVINNRQFLPDSYTRFKNKIGLADENGESLGNSGKIELVFPYKDCVLEGGQTKEEQKRHEVFYNETLATDEVDRLLYPKVLTAAVKYSADKKTHINEITNTDNLIIRGNNLLALASILKRFEGQIKCIYIDPPYNTGDDSFGYNDRFNHSSWLVFMKNRLELAKRLLKNDGAIFVQIDYHELGYVNVLMDEIFGIENKVQIISVKTASPAGFKTVNPGPIDVTEYILFYTKNKSNFKFKKGYVPVGYNTNYNLVLTRSHNIKDWKFTPIKEAVLKEAGFSSEKELKKQYGSSWKVILEHLIADFAFKHAADVVSIRDPHKPTDTVKQLMEQSKNVGYVLDYQREDGTTGYIYRGGALAFYSNKMKEVDGVITVTELLSDFWNHISWAGIAREGGVKLKNGKKPEKLIKQIFDISTNRGDIVLDYHLGSGTTCAVAHKMGLQYIGCEQLDYGDNDVVVRLKNVIAGDSTGISKAVDWHGGGSFVYCELKKLNQMFVDEIEAAEDESTLEEIFERIINSGFISYKVKPSDIEANANDYEGLSLDGKKRFQMELLDKNLLYVNYCDMDDEEYGISEEDKAFTRTFYKEG
jgi:adenine-specific DNA-methyltransferase